MTHPSGNHIEQKEAEARCRRQHRPICAIAALHAQERSVALPAIICQSIADRGVGTAQWCEQWGNKLWVW